ncbi:MAG: TetR/AcrR family transcriptional regulator, partial [Devosia sp.]
MSARRNGTRGKGSPRTSVWLQAAKEPRKPPQLSRDRIVAAAVEVLDAQGVDGLTMRRLADHLGSGVMSLYWHVDNKEDVFELALDSVFEYRGVLTAGGSRDWRQDIT